MERHAVMRIASRTLIELMAVVVAMAGCVPPRVPLTLGGPAKLRKSGRHAGGGVSIVKLELSDDSTRVLPEDDKVGEWVALPNAIIVVRDRKGQTELSVGLNSYALELGFRWQFLGIADGDNAFGSEQGQLCASLDSSVAFSGLDGATWSLCGGASVSKGTDVAPYAGIRYYWAVTSHQDLGNSQSHHGAIVNFGVRLSRSQPWVFEGYALVPLDQEPTKDDERAYASVGVVWLVEW